MKTVLLVIDVQMALAEEDAAGAERSCPNAEKNIATLLDRFRKSGDLVIHIHHHGTSPDDPFHPDASGSAVQPVARPVDGETVMIKTGSSGFMGTPLLDTLRNANIERVVLCGATANHCVESTTRSAADFGFQPLYACDAVWAYGATGPDGISHTAEQVHSVALANLAGEFASVMTTKDILAI